MFTKPIANFLKVAQKYEQLEKKFQKSGGRIDAKEAAKLAKEAKKVELAVKKLTPAETAYLSAMRGDAFEGGPSKVGGGGLSVDRTGSRFLPEPPGGRQVFVNHAGDKTVAARNGAKASWHSDVSTAIQRALAQGFHPIPEGSDSLEKGDAYHAAVVDELKKMGYRAFFDGEEVQVKKPGANHSEAYDISTHTGLVRDFYASWASPPAFD